MPNSGWTWDYEYLPRWRRVLARGLAVTRRPLRALLIGSIALLAGMQLGSAPSPVPVLELRARLRHAESALDARRGELELARLEVERLTTIVERSARHRIPADLAATIYDVARAEGLDPDVAFQLVDVESEFYPRAVSPKGAVGLTQVMPATAYLMNPKLRYADLFEPETNLRLGFRFLRDMVERYDGNAHLALLAYNRGPGTVDRIRRSGGDPNNGYARAVLGGGR